MNTKELQTADYLDILFEKRNKKYGGYELRRHYQSRTIKAVLGTLSGIAALFCLSFISARHKANAPIHVRSTPTIIADIQPPIQPPPPRVISPAQQLKTEHITPPRIERDVDVHPDDEMPENKKLTDAQPGLSTHDGDKPDITVATGNSNSGMGHTVVPDKPAEPVRWVEQMPEFNGDMYDYIGKNIRYPETARDAGIEGTVLVEFIVNEDGSVSGAHVVRSIGGGCDEEALRIVNHMPRWKPGKQNGNPVKVFFTLPIRFLLN